MTNPTPKLLIHGAALLGLLLSGSAFADDGLYGKLIVGANFQSDETFTGDAGSLFTGEAEFDPSFAGGGALGYRFGNLAVEGEVMYRTAELDSLSTDTAVDAFTEGDFSSVSIALNGLVHFDIFDADAYAGIGVVGLQEVDVDFELAGIENSLSGDDIGWQALFGVDFELTDRIDLYGEVRYLEVGGIDFELEDATLNEVIRGDYSNTGLNIGLRYGF